MWVSLTLRADFATLKTHNSSVHNESFRALEFVTETLGGKSIHRVPGFVGLPNVSLTQRKIDLAFDCCVQMSIVVIPRSVNMANGFACFGIVCYRVSNHVI